MARRFDGSNDKLSITAQILGAWTGTLACWAFLDDDSAAEETLMSLSDVSDDSPIYRLAKAAGEEVLIQTRPASGSQNKNEGGTMTIGQWEHMAATINVNGVGTPYLNGSSTAPVDTNTITFPTGIDTFTIGVLSRTSDDLFWDGGVAEAAIWDVELTTAEIVILANGFSPLFVRPSSLVSYWPLIGRYSPEIDIVGGNNLAVTEAVAGPHPRTIYPSRPHIVKPPAAAAAGGLWAGSLGLTGAGI